MTNNSLTTQFLKNRNLWQLVLALSAKKNESEANPAEASTPTETPINFSIYEMLATEYDRFLNEDYLSNIFLVVEGIDGQLFSSEQGEDLISRAYSRLETPLFGEGLEIVRYGFELHVIWTPPTPVRLTGHLKQKEKETCRNIIRYFDNELRLMVADVSFHPLKNSDGWEKFFYEKYFLPKKFKEILGDQESKQFSPLEKLENEQGPFVMDYILSGKRDLLQEIVDKQLPDSLGLDIQVDEPFMPDKSTYLFLPYFEARVKLSTGRPAASIIRTVSHNYEMIDHEQESEKILVISCRCSEGPYTFTVGQIVGNILHNLGPEVTAFFQKEGLELEKLSFTMTTLD